jgi:hypothetical protein
MGKTYEEITPELVSWLETQKLFFVATAPRAVDGLLNCSPKGMDTFRVLSPKQVAYLDLTGSGVETIAHLQENGRIVIMFCALTGPAKIVRLHGQGHVVLADSPDFEPFRPLFSELSGARAVIVADLVRIGESCGLGVPRYDFVDQQDGLIRLAKSKGDVALAQYRREKNRVSLDGLPALETRTLAADP